LLAPGCGMKKRQGGLGEVGGRGKGKRNHPNRPGGGIGRLLDTGLFPNRVWEKSEKEKRQGGGSSKEGEEAVKTYLHFSHRR